jgi:hypothetical protein
MSEVLWDPRDILGLDPSNNGFTCEGTNSTGNRCGIPGGCANKVNRSDRMDAARLLEELSTIDIYAPGVRDGTSFKRKLRAIAPLTLCVRWHRGRQVESLVDRWSDSIDQAYNRRREARRTRRREARQASQIQYRHREVFNTSQVQAGHREARHTSQVQHTVPVSSQLRQADSGRIARREELLDILERLESNRREQEALNRHMDALLEGIGRSSYRSNYQAGEGSNTPARRSARPSTPPPNRPAVHLNSRPQAAPVPPPQTIQPVTPSIPTLQAPAPAPPPPTTRVEQPVTQQAPGVRQVARRPWAGEDCYVCMEPFTDADDVAWCRGQCGQNIHSHCFDGWVATILDSTDLTCPHW